MGDPEVEAMSIISTALNDLDENACERVLQWAAARYGVTLPAGTPHDAGATAGVSGSNARDGAGEVRQDDFAGQQPSYEHFAELFAAAAPQTNEDKALVAAYWVQVHEGVESWQSRRVNSELKNLGHGIPNITDALSSNIQKKPQRIIQLKKSGSSRQATKTYKVTNEGIVYVRNTLSGQSD
jgi:hypothetical protein